MFGKFKEYKKGHCGQIIMIRGKVRRKQVWQVSRGKIKYALHVKESGLEFILFAMRKQEGGLI